MTLDPRWSFALSLALGMLAFVAAIPDWTNSGIDPTIVKRLLWWLGVGVGLGNVVNAALALVPSRSDPQSLKAFWLGPKAQPTADVPPKP